MSGAYTYAHYRFVDYGTPRERLAGNRLPGVPDHYWRFGLRGTLPYGFYADADHTLSSSMAADDLNTDLVADSWGAGVTNLRLGWDGVSGDMSLAPFIGINNLWDRQYVAR